MHNMITFIYVDYTHLAAVDNTYFVPTHKNTNNVGDNLDGITYIMTWSIDDRAYGKFLRKSSKVYLGK